MELNPVLRRAVQLGASDIHLKVGQPPILRRDGSLGPMEGFPALADEDLEAVLAIVGKRAPDRYEGFKQTGDLDIAYQDEDLPRFRVNAFKQRGSISFAFRVIPKNVPNFEQLRLPAGETWTGKLSTGAGVPWPTAKNSPSGTSTAGVGRSSQ